MQLLDMRGVQVFVLWLLWPLSGLSAQPIPVEGDVLKIYRSMNALAMDDPQAAEMLVVRKLLQVTPKLDPLERLQLQMFLFRTKMAKREMGNFVQEIAASLQEAQALGALSETAVFEAFLGVARLDSSSEDHDQAALAFLLKEVDRAKQAKQIRIAAHLLAMAADFEYKLGAVGMGMKHVRAVLDEIESISPADEPDLIWTKETLSQFLDNQGEPDKAAKVLAEMIVTLSAKPYRHKLAVTHKNLGMTFARERKDLARAEAEYKIAMDVARKMGHVQLEGLCQLALGGVYSLMDRLEEGDAAMVKSIALLESSRADPLDRADAWRIHARIFLRMHNWSAALKAADRAMIPKAIADNNFLILMLDTRALALAGLHRYEEAYKERTRYSEVLRTIQETEKKSDINRLKVDLGLKVEEDQNRMLQSENELQKRRLADEALYRQLVWWVIAVALIIIALMLVALRNARKVKKSKMRIKRILENIEEGILTVGPGMKIESDLSPYLLKMLGHKPGGNMLHRLINSLDMSDDEKKTILAVLQAVIDEDMVNWMINQIQLPMESSIEGGHRFLTLDWQPLEERGKVTMVVVRLRDVTARRHLQMEVDRARSQAENWDRRRTEVMTLNQRKAHSFLKESTDILGFIRERLPKNLEVATCYKRLHTMKGMARTLGFKELSQETHKLEEILDVDRIKPEHSDQLTKRLESFASVLWEYQDLVGKMFPEKPEIQSQDRSIHEILSQNLSAARSSLELGRFKLNSIEVRDAFLQWNDKLFQDIANIVTHGLNNSIDHGFILPRQRGKNMDDRVQIQIDVQDTGGSLRMELRDNGVGLDMNVLRSLAERKGFQPKEGQDWTDVLFLDGISTAEVVSESSGRGMGLAAIKEICQRWQGQVRLLPNDQGPGTLLRVDLNLQAQQAVA